MGDWFYSILVSSGATCNKIARGADRFGCTRGSSGRTAGPRTSAHSRERQDLSVLGNAAGVDDGATTAGQGRVSPILGIRRRSRRGGA